MATIAELTARLQEYEQNLLAENQVSDLHALNDLLIRMIHQYEKIRIRKVTEFQAVPETEEHPSAQFDPEHGDIFDPEHGDIFDPGEKFSPEDGLALRAIAEGMYDSYGNRISPKESEAVLLSLISWVLKWEAFEANLGAGGSAPAP